MCDEETTLLEDEFRFVAVMYGAVEHFKNVSFIAQDVYKRQIRSIPTPSAW